MQFIVQAEAAQKAVQPQSQQEGLLLLTAQRAASEM